MIAFVKRIVAGVLWFLAIWSAGNFVGGVVGLPEVVGPILGLAVGVLVVVDPGRQIWSKRRPDARSVGLDPGSARSTD
jgi:membrane associated rhomboid family serine protease